LTAALPRLGVDLGGTKIEVVALAPDGTERFRRRVPTPRGDYAATLAAIVSLVDAAELAVGAGRGSCAVGVGTPGSPSRASGLMRNCNSTWLNGKPLPQDLAYALARPVNVTNDADCFALSEAVDGAARGARIVFGAILGTGVGAGIVVHGSLLQGINGIAGEWGHNPLPWPEDDERPGPPCYCGRSGCIETLLSGPGLAADHARSGHESLPADSIVAAAAEGDADCERTLQRYEGRLARSLAHVVNIVDPDVIVLGGGLSNVERLYRNVPALLSRWVFSDRVDTRLVRNLHGDSSGVRGAAWFAAHMPG
jgi:predicted NBD/HSP70 family sugar kinase